ncbi:MAG TPA: hypothetical protein PK286_14755, partial [Devosia sp.]|nr:hypothetical protein [Devosia sp.]
LLDGASAVYGSDAVGGVVNVILKRRGDGAATSLRFGSTTQGGGQQLQLGQTWGTSWRSGGLLLGYEFNRQERVEASEREIGEQRGPREAVFANPQHAYTRTLFAATPRADVESIRTRLARKEGDANKVNA